MTVSSGTWSGTGSGRRTKRRAIEFDDRCCEKVVVIGLSEDLAEQRGKASRGDGTGRGETPTREVEGGGAGAKGDMQVAEGNE